MADQRSTSLRDAVLTLAGIALLLAFARYASAIVVPFLLALFIAIIAATPVNWLKKRGLPVSLSVGLVILAVMLLLVLIALMLGSSMEQFNLALPEYQAQLTGLADKVVTMLAGRGIDIRESGLMKALDPGVVLQFANTLVTGIANVLSNAALIMFTVTFMLFDVIDFPRKFATTEGGRGEETIRNIARIMASTNQYIAIKAVVSLVTGILVWLGLMLVGLDFAVLWGFIAFILNFVPNIGSLLAAVPAVLLALIQLSPPMVLVVIAIYAAINVIMGNVVEPKVMGSRLGLSTLAVFLSLVFWGWLFGPVGMLLSVPLTMVVKFTAMTNPQTRWFGLLLSPAPEEKAEKSEKKTLS